MTCKRTHVWPPVRENSRVVGDTEVIHARLFAKVDLADVTSEPVAQFTCDTVRLFSSDPQ